MNDLISRAAAIAAFNDERVDRNYGDVSPESVIRVIESIPTVDAAPVTHAEWVYDPDDMDWNLGAWKCSKCHCRNDNLPGNLPKTNPYRWAGSKYCPNCGAKMGKADV